MGEFGWAYLSGTTTGQGPSGSVQYTVGTDGALTGSNTFTFESHQNTLFVSGSVVVSGTLSANTMDVIHTNKIEIDT